MEIELKLLVAPEHLARLERHPALKALRQGARRKKTLRTVYFDTPECDLAKAGIALRLRKDGARWIQTIKGDGEAAAGLHVREELEWNVAGEALDFAALGNSRYKKIFAKRDMRTRIAPVFSTHFERAVQQLVLADGTAIEFAVDRGDIRAGRRRAPISEAELELKKGDAHRMFELAGRLARDVPVRLGNASKAARGYALASAAVASPQKAQSIELAPSSTAAAALQRIARACIAQMQANEDGVLSERDPGSLHQLRVGVRKLRSCLGLMRQNAGKRHAKALTTELRWLQHALGPAREWDVFMADVLAPLCRRHSKDRRLAAFRAQCLRLQRAGAEEAKAAIASPRYAALVLALGEAFAGEHLEGVSISEPREGGRRSDERPKLDAPAAAFSAFVLEARHRRLRKRGAGLAGAGPKARHQARIAAKKLRYAAQFFASLHAGRRAERYLKAVEHLQDILGALNDAAVAERLIAEAAAHCSAPVGSHVENLLRNRLASSFSGGVAEYEAAWRRFESVKPFWR